MRRVLAAAALLSSALATGRAGAVPVEGTVLLDGVPGTGTVLYLEGARETPAPARPARVVMDQRNLAFMPRVLPVVRGTIVEFHNSDDVSHNVFSPSASAQEFNLGTYGRGEARTLTLREPGDVLVLCNIHMEMEAHILVLRYPYFTTVGTDGRYRVGDVPAGSYHLRLWRDGWLPYARTVEITEAAEGATSAPIAVDVRLER